MMPVSNLREFHKGMGAQFTALAAAEVVGNYGDDLAEHRALTESAGWIDLSFRGRICLTGVDRARFLHGQVTNDVKILGIGEGCYAALVTAKGKMQSDLNIFCLADELLLDFEPGLTPAITERLEKFIIADDVHITDVSTHYGLLAINGPKADEAMRGTQLVPELPRKTLSFVSNSHPILGLLYIMNHPRVGSAGFDLFVPVNALGAVADSLVAAVKSVGGCACGWQAFETARLEAGIPRFGADMDETNIPLEAGIDARAISFKKGCYIGQEVISRIRTYGQVAKALRGLRLEGDRKLLPARGDKLLKADKEVGYITSSVFSPRLNAAIALGYVRKEVNEIGTELMARCGTEQLSARIVPLPF